MVDGVGNWVHSQIWLMRSSLLSSTSQSRDSSLTAGGLQLRLRGEWGDLVLKRDEGALGAARKRLEVRDHRIYASDAVQHEASETGVEQA